MPWNVMIVDDQLMSRRLFELYVEASPDYRLVRSIDSAIAADIYCKSDRIDLILMDVVMAEGMDGLEAAARVKRLSPETKIIIVTSMPEVSYLRRARQIGVESFWYKELSREPILQIMDRTMAGESVYPDASPTVELGRARSTDLTERELDVLREMTTGSTNAEIAAKLGISAITVRNHIQSLMMKTGFRSRTALAVNARVTGLVISGDRGQES